MNVLVSHEYSGIVRDEFSKKGWNAWSCDLLPTESELTKQEGKHYQGDLFDIINDNWDLLIAFPPCTHLAVSGARHFLEKRKDGRQDQAIGHFMRITALKIKHISIENPVGIMSSIFRKPDQIIQPWQFGHGETKSTCLWLKNLPHLKPTKIVEGREQRIWKMPPGPDRAKERSKTFPGIAEAMAGQWTEYIVTNNQLTLFKSIEEIENQK